jgi:ATP-dependent RNA helicase RhlE
LPHDIKTVQPLLLRRTFQIIHCGQFAVVNCRNQFSRAYNMSFASLGLSDPILQAVTANGYDTPTPIQAQAIPAIIEGKDVMGAAQTGTGKTAGFTLPILERLSQGERAKSNHIRALILTPTRELAAQVQESVTTYGKNLSLSSAVVFGGVKINPQMMKLRRGVDILVATPGRLLDLHNQNAVNFSQVEVLVLDEADRMLDMGFIHDIKKILSKLPAKRQNLLFSATFSNEIRSLAKGMVNNPIEISVSPRNTTVELVEQLVHPVDKAQKSALLTKLIQDGDWRQVLVFTRTKHGANKLAKQLDSRGIRSAAIHGNKSQAARTKALLEFKNGQTPVLVATDIAARGLDIEQLPHVVNFDLPNVPEDYVHRIGRTGRAGASGQAVSLVSADEVKMLSGIEKLIQQVLTRKLIDGFEPDHSVPETRLSPSAAPKKPKKPTVWNNGGGRTGGNRSQGNQRTGNANGNSGNANSGNNSPRAKQA